MSMVKSPWTGSRMICGVSSRMKPMKWAEKCRIDEGGCEPELVDVLAAAAGGGVGVGEPLRAREVWGGVVLDMTALEVESFGI